MASVQRRVDYLEGTAMPHARRQEHANGFQVGWHSALDRICENPNFDELRAQVPDSRPVAPAEPPRYIHGYLKDAVGLPLRRAGTDTP